MTPFTLADFRTAFGDGSVRVLLDWDALAGCEVDLRVSRSRDLLGGLFTAARGSCPAPTSGN